MLPGDSDLTAMENDRGVPVANASNRELATRFAASLFPADPVVMDYPLFLHGRYKNIGAMLLE